MVLCLCAAVPAYTASACANASSGAGVPSGYAAVVQGVEGGAGLLSMQLFDKRVPQVRAERRATGVTNRSSAGEEALRQLLEEVEVEAETERLGIHLEQRRVTKAFRQIKQHDFPSIASFHDYLRRVRLSEAESRRRIEVQILSERIEEHVLDGVPESRRSVAMGHWADWYLGKWRARTNCRQNLATDRCSNGPPLSRETDSGFAGGPAPR